MAKTNTSDSQQPCYQIQPTATMLKLAKTASKTYNNEHVNSRSNDWNDIFFSQNKTFNITDCFSFCHILCRPTVYVHLPLKNKVDIL